MSSGLSNSANGFHHGRLGYDRSSPTPIKAPIAAGASAPGSESVVALYYLPSSHVTFTRDITEEPQYINKRTHWLSAAAAGLCQGTKSLRSSPLRGARGERPVAG
jgi:hypothetical protein